MLADSVQADAPNKQNYIVHWSLVNGVPVHVRHTGRANILFADGSVRSLSPSELTSLSNDDGGDEEGTGWGSVL